MAVQRVINREPDDQPNKSQQPGQHEGVTPPQENSNPGHGQRRHRAAHARAAIENRHRHAALFGRKPLGDGFAGAGPVAALADAQEKTKYPEGKDGVREAGQHADDRPPDDRQGKPQARANDIEQDATDQPHAGVRNLEGREDTGKIGVAEVQLPSDDRGQHGERLAADVVDYRGTEERPDNPPANSLGSHRSDRPWVSNGSALTRNSRDNTTPRGTLSALFGKLRQGVVVQFDVEAALRRHLAR